MARTQLFTASQFTPTHWDTADEKARFANHLVRFVDTGCKWTLFHTWFYRRLSMCFGHIAHYNKAGFYATWFTQHRGDFLEHLLQHRCYGDPTYTYSDVEQALQCYYRQPIPGRARP